MQAIYAAMSRTPGFFIIALWFLLLIILWILCKFFLDEEGRFCDSDDLIAVHSDSILYAFTAIAFAVSALMNFGATIMQTTKKKRQCASLVLFIEVIACTTYVSLFLKLFPDLKAYDGKPFDWLHIFQWAFTTPTMLVILSGLGTSMEDRFVADWTLTIRSILYDELTLLSGLFSMIFTGWIRFVFLLTAIFSFAALCKSISKIIKLSIENAGTRNEVQTLAILKWLTYCLWASFGVCQTLEFLSFFDRIEHRTVRTILDCLVKTIYSVFLLSSNIHVLDVVAEIRLVQLQDAAERQDRFSKRNELMNRALQLACVETEAKDRLSRRFVCNMSHELRTPLHSIIAFNTLLMESTKNEEHIEIIQNSLDSAQGLLRIITHLLDHVRTEGRIEASTAENANSIPFCLVEVIDDVLDMVAETSIKKCVDVVASYAMPGPSVVGCMRDVRQMLFNLCELSIQALSRLHPKEGFQVLRESVFICMDSEEAYLESKASGEVVAGQSGTCTVTIYIGGDPAALSAGACGSCMPRTAAHEASRVARQGRAVSRGASVAAATDLAEDGGEEGLLLLLAQSVAEAAHGTIQHVVSGARASPGFRVTLPLSIPRRPGPPMPAGQAPQPLLACSTAGPARCEGTVLVCLEAGPLAQLVLRHAALWGFHAHDCAAPPLSHAAAVRAALTRSAAECDAAGDGDRRVVWVLDYGHVVGRPDSAELLRLAGPRLVLVGAVGQGYAVAADVSVAAALDGAGGGAGLGPLVEASLLVRPVKLSALRARLTHVLAPASPPSRSPRRGSLFAGAWTGGGDAAERASLCAVAGRPRNSDGPLAQDRGCAARAQGRSPRAPPADSPGGSSLEPSVAAGTRRDVTATDSDREEAMTARDAGQQVDTDAMRDATRSRDGAGEDSEVWEDAVVRVLLVEDQVRDEETDAVADA
jgi:signal transduction histidine kinase